MRILKSASVVAACVFVAASAHGADTGVRHVNVVGTPAADKQVSFDIFLPLRDEAALDTLLDEQQRAGSAQYHKWLTPEQFKARFGAVPDAVAKLSGVLTSAGLSVVEHGSSLRATGSVAQVEGVIGTQMVMVSHGAGRAMIAAAGAMKLDPAFAASGAQVFAFNPYLPPRHVHSRKVAKLTADPANRYGIDGPYWYNDLKEAYDYPSFVSQVAGGQLTGQGVNIGILMSSDVLDSDIAAQFDHEGFSATSGLPDPVVFQRRLVEGGAPFSTDSDGSFEASLDVQEALGGAPGANLWLYNIPDLGDDSVSGALVDVVEDNSVDILSMSFGGCERSYGPYFNQGQSYFGVLDSLHRLFKQGNAEGITFIASSGDNGGLGCPSPNYVSDGVGITNTGGPYVFVHGIETPADDPNVTSVGGTNLVTTPPPSDQPSPPTIFVSRYVLENGTGDPEIPYDVYGFGGDADPDPFNVSGGYWGAGGGFSAHFKKPGYQKLVKTGSPMRTVPDIGMQVGGCPGGIAILPCPKTNSKNPDRSAVVVYVGGDEYELIGTSVAAPEFAGALALKVQFHGDRLGNINPMLYAMAADQNAGGIKAYHRNITGFDGLYHASKPYNYIVGNGTPNIRALFHMLPLEPASIPRTAGNP